MKEITVVMKVELEAPMCGRMMYSSSIFLMPNVDILKFKNIIILVRLQVCEKWKIIFTDYVLHEEINYG